MAKAGRPAILSDHLLLSIAEQLKVPFMQISRRAELAVLTSQQAAGKLDEETQRQVFAQIQTTADMSVRLLDNYLFGARLALEDDYQLQIEPVSLSSVLYDTGQQLDATAKLYGVDLELSLGGKFGPVLANRQGLQAALVSLGYGLIEALPNLGTKRMTLQLAAHRCRYGIVAGMYTDVEQLTTEALRQGRKLYGQTRQPLATLTHSSGAGIFVADAILQAMHSELKVSRHHKLYGLGTVLKPNAQLHFV
jgi:K+-sensing histidine kinase KdpD